MSDSKKEEKACLHYLYVFGAIIFLIIGTRIQWVQGKLHSLDTRKRIVLILFGVIPLLLIIVGAVPMLASRYQGFVIRSIVTSRYA